MKISRIYTVTAIMSKDHKFSFDKKNHKLEYFAKINMFSIDGTLIPPSNVREVVVDNAPEIEMVEVDHTLVDSPLADRSFEILDSDFFLETRFKDEPKDIPVKAKRATKQRDGG